MRKSRVWMAAWVLSVCLMPLFPAAAETVASDEVFTLGEVIVSGEEQVVNLATTVTEVTAEDIKQRGAQTVAEALEQLPGVDVQKGGKSQNYVSIRGFDQSDVKVLVDGVPVHEQYYRTLDLDQIPVDSIAKITVTKGASSVLYGSNTMGGVINIITKKAGAKPSATVSGAWGDYGTERYSASVSGPAGKFNYWLGYTYRHSNGWRLSDDYDEDYWAAQYSTYTKDDGGLRDDSGYLQHTFNTKFGFEPNNDTKLYLTFDYHDNEKGIPSDGWYFDEWRQWQISLVGEHRFNDMLRVKARGFYVDHKDTLLETEWDDRDWFYKSSYDGYSVGGELQAFMDFGKWSFLKVGVSYLRDNTKQEEILAPGGSWEDAGEYESDTYSFGVEDEIRVSDWLAFTVGASYDYFDPRKASGQPVPDSVDAFNPQLGVIVNLTDSTMLHGSVGKKIRFPHLKELFSESVGGNPDLDPQETIAYEVGVSHAFNDAVSGSVAFFYNDIKDLIVRDYVAGYDDRVYYNVGKANILGVEFSLGADITERFWVGVNYTYLNTEDEELDRELAERARHRANLDMRYRFPFGLAVSTQLSYVNRYYYEKEVARRTYEWTKGTDFLLLNARAEQSLGELWGVSGKAFVEVTNLTDRDYEESGELMPGRNFLAGLSFTY
ncbi:TonB-dependent receptor plug domain-containing protein [Syntrophotalea acetylenica]|uniref:TonB-dependent receptor n=1 Tax=Syntrophotalea acetylenica TaxID=29542 RepID=A0A1L3GFW0_SYNAC|nr:TonB-dependent receptor [Syntrophotalea acetylenica]APG24568.1 TonB-dependent receptor [Syntrophotalea acetylenica]APG45152.1 TonB-dependent receptor [Syntrophotalea acetylenica]MDY0262795.1 TonB-dependent receptor [Syntrophotalea acetylenica]